MIFLNDIENDDQPRPKEGDEVIYQSSGTGSRDGTQTTKVLENEATVDMGGQALLLDYSSKKRSYILLAFWFLLATIACITVHTRAM